MRPSADATSPKLFVLVLMPFADEFRRVYEKGIKPACDAANAYCERLDEQIFQETIISRIYNQIAKADIIVADMSGLNPNVFYEVGYAHALAREVILLTNNADDIPYDLKHYPHIVYQGEVELLREELQKRIEWLVSNPEKTLDDVESFVDLYITGSPIETLGMIAVEHKTPVRLKIDIHNPRSKTHEAGKIRLGIVSGPGYDSSSYSEKVVSLPDGRYLHLLPPCGAIFPESWDSARVKLESNHLDLVSEKEEFLVRVFTELGVSDYPVSAEFE